MDEKLQPRLGEMLREARRRLGLTQAEVARRVGLVPAVYGRLERGTGLPSLLKLKALCDELHLSADVVLSLRSPDAPSAAPRLEGPVELRRILSNLRGSSPATLRALDRLVKMFSRAERER